MRVISGRCKGRVLFSPRSGLIRPTSDKLKEFIFDNIDEKIQDAVVLDLFSGTGNLSIEALSRGARFSVLVDKSKEAIRLIYRNLELTNLLSQCQIVHKDVLRYLKAANQHINKFNFVFADPPYSVTLYQNIVENIGNSNLLEDGGFFILEHSSRQIVADYHKLLYLKTTRDFGDSAVTFYLKKGN